MTAQSDEPSPFHQVGGFSTLIRSPAEFAALQAEYNKTGGVPKEVVGLYGDTPAHV